MENEYTEHMQYDTNLGGVEGHTYELVDLEILNAIPDDIFIGIIEKQQGRNSDFTSYQSGYNDGADFSSEHSTWLEFFKSLLDGNCEQCMEEVAIEVLKELIQNNYINNCSLIRRHYYESKRKTYYHEISKPKRILGKPEVFFTTKEILDELVKKGSISEVQPGIYRKNKGK